LGGQDADFDAPPVTDRLADIERFVTPLLSIVNEALPDTLTVVLVTVPDR
jgi:hypothetical protein